MSGILGDLREDAKGWRVHPRHAACWPRRAQAGCMAPGGRAAAAWHRRADRAHPPHPPAPCQPAVGTGGTVQARVAHFATHTPCVVWWRPVMASISTKEVPNLVRVAGRGVRMRRLVCRLDAPLVVRCQPLLAARAAWRPTACDPAACLGAAAWGSVNAAALQLWGAQAGHLTPGALHALAPPRPRPPTPGPSRWLTARPPGGS